MPIRQRVKILFVVPFVALLAWWGVRVVFAVRNDEPAYKLPAGVESIREEWNFCSRFGEEINPAKLTLSVRVWNRLHDCCFSSCYPLFWAENRILGKKIGKGDPGYDAYMRQVRRITAANWDYVIASSRDGRSMIAVKNGRPVQEID